MSNEITEEKWKAEHAIFREQIPGYSRSGFSFFQGEMFYLAGRNAGQAEIDLYSNAFKTADELRISSAERYDKEIQKRDAEIVKLKKRSDCNDYVCKFEEQLEKRDKLLEQAKPWAECYKYEGSFTTMEQWIKDYKELLK